MRLRGAGSVRIARWSVVATGVCAVLRPDGFLWAEWLALGWVLCTCFYSTAVRTFTVVPSSVEV